MKKTSKKTDEKKDKKISTTAKKINKNENTATAKIVKIPNIQAIRANKYKSETSHLIDTDKNIINNSDNSKLVDKVPGIRK